MSAPMNPARPGFHAIAMVATVAVASFVIISGGVYLLFRVFAKRNDVVSRDEDVFSRDDLSKNEQRHADLLESLPVFTFASVKGKVNGGSDCAVCLSKFEPDHRLRLLPLCCHAFHADCIDKWIVASQTCPLCRSTVRASDSAALDKILSRENRGSFRVELGSISRRSAAAEGARRSYSLESYEYVVDDVHEVSISDIGSGNKESSIVIQEAEAEAPVRNWLREYLMSISSRTTSFRSSSRYFSGSEAAAVPEANGAGEEISEAFRWLSEF